MNQFKTSPGAQVVVLAIVLTSLAQGGTTVHAQTTPPNRPKVDQLARMMSEGMPTVMFNHDGDNSKCIVTLRPGARNWEYNPPTGDWRDATDDEYKLGGPPKYPLPLDNVFQGKKDNFGGKKDDKTKTIFVSRKGDFVQYEINDVNFSGNCDLGSP